MVHGYSPLIILFICMQLISLLLLLNLMYIILDTAPFFKRTLLQFCICTFLVGLLSLPLIIIYGNDLQEKAFDTPLCIMQNKISGFLYSPLKMLPAILSIYLWLETYFNDNIEQKYFWHFTGGIWGLAILINIIGLIIDSKKKDWGAQAGVLFCKQSPSKFVWWSYIIPTSIMTFMSIIITGTPKVMSIKWSERGTVIKISLFL